MKSGVAVGEYQGKEACEYQAGAEDYQTYPAIKIAHYGYYFIDPGLIMIKERFVQHISNSRANAQLGEIEESEQVLQSAGEAYEVGAQAVEENLAGKEAEA